MEINTPARRYLLDDENGISTANATLCTGIDELFNRKVAVKIIPFEKSLSEQGLNEAYSRAQNEMSVMSAIGAITPRVPYLLDKWFDEENRKLYIFMQWIQGNTLREKMQSALKKPIEFLQWMIELSQILALIEQKRYYHNDIKPENVMIDNKGELYLIDFNLTVSNKTMHEGTPHYIAPELNSHIQARKDKADMFSLGVIMYEYFTGVLPMRGTHYGMKRKLFSKDTVLTDWDEFKEPVNFNEKLNPQLNSVIVRLMKRIPTDRFNSYADLKKELIKVKKSIR